MKLEDQIREKMRFKHYSLRMSKPAGDGTGLRDARRVVVPGNLLSENLLAIFFG